MSLAKIYDYRFASTHAYIGERYISSHRYEGIRFPSSKETGAINLMIWIDKIETPSFVEVHDPSGRLWQRIPADKT
jgi:RES domain-containing protein